VPDWLASAKESVYIEQQYIKGKQPAVRKLLGAIRSAMDRNPDLVVRIVLGRLFESAADEAQSLKALADYGLEAGTHVRFLSSRYFVHCHDKLIIVDRRQALVSSQNWSDSAVLYNREAGLLIDYVPLVRYYTSIFGLDWETGDNPRAVPFAPAFAEAVSFGPGAQVPISLGDYVEV
jgi:phosphatidylserine/phosphatidylglycerophosphate/cardiolipin synthase-like enzyme